MFQGLTTLIYVIPVGQIEPNKKLEELSERKDGTEDPTSFQLGYIGTGKHFIKR